MNAGSALLIGTFRNPDYHLPALVRLIHHEQVRLKPRIIHTERIGDPVQSALERGQHIVGIGIIPRLGVAVDPQVQLAAVISEGTRIEPCLARQVESIAARALGRLGFGRQMAAAVRG